MAFSPDGPWTRLLVAWYGLYQAVHVFVNTRGLGVLLRGEPLGFPAPPPQAGWPEEVVHMMVAIGVLDLVGALAALVFVWGYFRRARWRMWLGTLTLTVSVYAASVYAYSTYASGAWSNENLIVYLIVIGGFLPILVLWCAFCVWGARGFGSAAPADNDAT